MKRFEELEAQVMADPARQERVERERTEVVAAQVRDALGELRRVRQLTQVELGTTSPTGAPARAAKSETCQAEAGGQCRRSSD